jgi:branched-chain amino acid transport system permease protein
MAWVQTATLASLQNSVIYLLLTVALVLQISVTKMFNLAHGSLVAIGAYTAVWVSVVYPSPLVFFVSIFTTATVTLVIEKGVYNPLSRRGLDLNGLLVVSFGVLLIVQTILLILATLQGGGSFFGSPQIETVRLFSIGSIAITNLFVWSALSSVGILVALYFVYKKTRIGKAFSAVSDNKMLAEVTGINITRVRDLAWVITGAMTGLGGGFLAMYGAADPNLGTVVMIQAYAAAAFGGLTGYKGAIIGTFIVGFAQNVLINFLGASFNIDVAYKPAIVLGTVMILLIVQFGRTRIGDKL